MKHIITDILGVSICLLAVHSCKKAETDTPIREFDLKISSSISSSPGPGSKATLLGSESSIPDNKLKLYGWEGDTYWIKGVEATKTTEWNLPGSYSMSSTKNYSFLSYANLPSGGASITPTEEQDGDLTFTVTDIVSAQNDVLLGRCTVDAPTSGDVELDFSHPYASVKFILGNATGVGTVTSVSLSGVYESGTTTISQASTPDGSGVMQYTWTSLGNANAVIEASGLSKTMGQHIATFVVIPQDLSEKNAVMTVTYDSGSKMTKLLSGESWVAGYTTTYTLDKIGTIAVSIVPESNSVTNSGSSKIYVRCTITGAWYIGSEIVAPYTLSAGDFTGLAGAGWTNDGDFYYYGSAIDNGSNSTPIFTSFTKPDAPVEGATLKLDVLVQAIPYNVNKTCKEAFEAL